MTPDTSPEMLRVSDVLKRTGMSRTSLYRKLREGAFPAPLELGCNAIGWPDFLVAEWIASRPRRTYGEAA
jgi:prophage regulatory protein